MRLHTTAPSGVTLVQNTFIDHHMIQANGEYVKVYLYLLRCAGDSAGDNMDLTLSSVADAMECTEKDLLRALSYWEKAGLLQISRDSDGTIQDIIFDEPAGSAGSEPAASAGTEPAVSDDPMFEAAKNRTLAISRERADALMNDPDICQLLFVAEQYLGRPLSSSELNDLLYYYDALHFSTDLIEYLLEYCLSKGSFSRHYIQKVAFAWADKEIKTVAEAREETNLYNRHYFSIMKVFGIRNRNPSEPELEYMTHWYTDMDFSPDIILEACRRSSLQTHEPNFKYANKILENWQRHKVRSAADIEVLDKQHQEEQKDRPQQQTPDKTGSSNRFNNFSQREYDYSQLERQLLNS